MFYFAINTNLVRSILFAADMILIGISTGMK